MMAGMPYAKGVNDQFVISVAPYRDKYNLDRDQVNAAKHAIASAVYSKDYGPGVASFLGGLLEAMTAGNDDYRDLVNNGIGRAIQAAFPERTEQEYHDVIANLASQGLLYSSQLPYGSVPVSETIYHLSQRAIRAINDQGLFGDPRAECFLARTMIDMWDGSQKPIEEITPDDVVVSIDKSGKQVPGRVTRTFETCSKHILDVHGLMMTPGHVTFCAKVAGEKNRFAGTYVPVIDILRSDGALMKKDGTCIRAATGYEIGSEEDRLIPAVVTEPVGHDDLVRTIESGSVRLGTTFMAPDGRTITVKEIITRVGGTVCKDGLVQLSDGSRHTFVWTLTRSLPKPEDYVLQRSDLSLADIYAADEWEAVRPQMPAPVRGEAGPSFGTVPGTLYADGAMPEDAIPPNIPLSMRGHPNQPTMSRMQRRAVQARQRKETKKAKVLH